MGMGLLHELVLRSAERVPGNVALWSGRDRWSYGQLSEALANVASGLLRLGLGSRDRVAVFLPKSFEAVVAFFATSRAGGTFVPVNPVLKAAQVAHILRDSGARVLITSASRAEALEAGLSKTCPTLAHLVLVDKDNADRFAGIPVTPWSLLLDAERSVPARRSIDLDMAAILYTSGSTGKPKGVVLSHRNLVAGARSVAEYLGNDESDRLLAVLPFSFDYGFSQLSTAFLTGASVAMIEYLLPRDILIALERYEITGLAAVPPVWIQLAAMQWPVGVSRKLRYITNSGGAMPSATLAKLRERLPSTAVFLMYGLTEAFRSTYLPPDQVDVRPTSIGRAIPNAEILVVRPDGTPCAPGEPGELVHRGVHVSLGYWNDRERTAARFRPAPGQAAELPLPELAVWSGDTVVKDDEGYLYFVGRSDEMIKTSGYRVSPTEVEEVLYATGLVSEAVAFGAPHPVLGQAIVVVAVASRPSPAATDELLAACRRELPTYMVPSHVEWLDALPRNANGKIDRPALAAGFGERFAGLSA
jgi:acyl-CoA ligase (AMP-forming) (exosortase A-associated)